MCTDESMGSSLWQKVRLLKMFMAKDNVQYTLQNNTLFIQRIFIAVLAKALRQGCGKGQKCV
jgi:hypothetical protein